MIIRLADHLCRLRIHQPNGTSWVICQTLS